MVNAQTLVIPDWLPPNVSNGSHGHWARRQAIQKQCKTMAWASAQHAGWQRVRTRARLTITLVFAQHRRRDRDNLYARCKGIVDGLKPFMVDDSLEWLDLIVNVEVHPKTRQTHLTLEAVHDPPPSAA